jgi:hypothetical protein
MESSNVPAFRTEVLHDGWLIIYKLGNVTRGAVDAWVEAVKSRLDTWDKKEPYYSIHDLSDPKVGITPYSRARASEIMAYRTDVPSYTALVMPRTFATQLIVLFYNSLKPRGRSTMRVFFSMTEARTWLESEMRQNGVIKDDPVVSIS